MVIYIINTGKIMESLIENMSACNRQQDSSDEANDPGSKKLKYEISDIISNFKAKTQVDRMILIKNCNQICSCYF